MARTFLENAEYQYGAKIKETARLLFEMQYGDAALWHRIADQFRVQKDSENLGWRGEYWGKSMRGATLLYHMTKDAALYARLEETVREMLTLSDPDGRVSSYRREREYDGWDLWGRKYVLIGMASFFEVCRDATLKGEIARFCLRCLSDITRHVGVGAGKIPVPESSRFWLGINSSSFIEAAMAVYRITGARSCLDFAGEILESGGARGIDVLKLALENKCYPYQYGVPKAYELTSFFIGTGEYYRVTGKEKYRQALVNFAKSLLDSDYTVIGSAGVTHELLDFSRYRQTVPYEGISEETCVTVTLMRLFWQLYTITGEAVFADCMERSFHNAYLGAVNTGRLLGGDEKYREMYPGLIRTLLPFDSYSPLLPSRRGRQVGGFQLLPDGTYYGCCAAIGGAGLGVFVQSALMCEGENLVVSQYLPGRVKFSHKGQARTFECETNYPVEGDILMTFELGADFPGEIYCRIPSFTQGHYTLLAEGGTHLGARDGYAVLRPTASRVRIRLSLPMEVKAHRPLPFEDTVIYHNDERYEGTVAVPAPFAPACLRYISFSYGPLVLAADGRTGTPAEGPFCFSQKEGERLPFIRLMKEIPGVTPRIFLELTSKDGRPVRLIDYASAGKDYKTPIAAFLPLSGED